MTARQRLRVLIGVVLTFGVFAVAAHQALAQEAGAETPALVDARTDSRGEEIILTFSEDVAINPLARLASELYDVPVTELLRIALRVTVGGHEHGRFEASPSGNRLIVSLTDGPIESGQRVTVAYNRLFGRDLAALLIDADRNPVPPFSAAAVENLSTVRPGPPAPAGPTLSPGSLRIVEGGSGWYFVRLSSQPEGEVTIHLSTWPAGAIGVEPTSMTFTRANWDEPQVALVTTTEDSDSIDSWAMIFHDRVDAATLPEAVMRIIVADADDPVRIVGAETLGYTENAATPVASYDIDTPSTIRWSLVGEDAEFFSISRTGELSFLAPPDHEDPVDSDSDSVYDLGVYAASGTSTGLLPVTVTVANENEPPEVFGPVRVRLAGNSGTLVGTYSYDDPEGRTAEWSLSGSDRSRFTITNGSLRFSAPPDFESSADANRDNIYHVTVRAEDPGGLVGTRRVTVAVLDDAAASPNAGPAFPGSSTIRWVGAGSTARTRVGPPVAAADPDGDPLTYRLQSADAALFHIDEHTGQIRVAAGAGPQLVAGSSYGATVTATDPAGSSAGTHVGILVESARSPSPGRSSTPSSVDYEWSVEHDLDALDIHNNRPTGLWSDGTTLWITESEPGEFGAVYAYDLPGGGRAEQAEFELDRANRAPNGIAGDGTTAWVSDDDEGRFFAYDLGTGERAEHRDIPFDSEMVEARGLWADDGGRMWAVDGERDLVVVYDVESGDVLAEYRLDPGNGSGYGIWSDGTTLWVSDHGAKSVFAYVLPTPRDDGRRSSLTREPERDFTELPQARNNSPRGIWSDGGVMYVADRSDGHIYSYNMPDATDARLLSLTLSGVDIGEFTPTRRDYAGVADTGIEESTVDPHRAQPRSVVVTAPPDSDRFTTGHQVPIADGAEITVTVTSPDRSRTAVYRVRIAQAPPAPCLRGAVAVGFSLVSYEGGTVGELVACAESRHITALYATRDGAFVPYVLGAPGFVNRDFRALFAAGLPADTPLLAASDGPPSP